MTESGTVRRQSASTELTIGGSETEMLDWLGPHDLPCAS
jgi:hypothetical protein